MTRSQPRATLVSRGVILALTCIAACSPFSKEKVCSIPTFTVQPMTIRAGDDLTVTSREVLDGCVKPSEDGTLHFDLMSGEGHQRLRIVPEPDVEDIAEAPFVTDAELVVTVTIPDWLKPGKYFLYVTEDNSLTSEAFTVHSFPPRAQHQNR